MSPPRKPRRRRTYAWLAILLLAGLLISRVFHLTDSLFFYPSRAGFLTPPGYRDVTFSTPDGLTLHGWFLPPTDSQGRTLDGRSPAVLHVHGNAGNVESHIAFSQFLPRRGIGVLIFDYRGFGRSDPAGRITRDRLMIDTQAAWDALKRQPEVDTARLGVLAVSIGNTFASRLAATNADCRAVVAAAPFTSWPRIAHTHAPVLGALLVRPGLDPIVEYPRMAVGERPLFIVHGEHDTIVPVSHGKRLLAAALAAGVPAEMLTVPTAGHNDLIIEDATTQSRIAEFLTRALTSAAERSRSVNLPSRP